MSMDCKRCRRAGALAALPALLLLGTVAVPPAHAGRPLATEDAGILEAAACELEPSFTRVRSSGETERTSVLQVACGTPWRTQLHANVQRHAGSENETAFGFGGKTGLHGGADTAVALTLAYGFDVTHAAAGGARRIGSGFVNLVASGEVSSGVTAHANLGTQHVREPRRNVLTWNTAAEWAAGGGVDLMGEFYGNDRGERWLGAGARWTVGAWSVNGAVARQTSAPKASLLTVGAKVNI